MANHLILRLLVLLLLGLVVVDLSALLMLLSIGLVVVNLCALLVLLLRWWWCEDRLVSGGGLVESHRLMISSTCTTKRG